MKIYDQGHIDFGENKVQDIVKDEVIKQKVGTTTNVDINKQSFVNKEDTTILGVDSLNDAYDNNLKKIYKIQRIFLEK